MSRSFTLLLTFLACSLFVLNACSREEQGDKSNSKSEKTTTEPPPPSKKTDYRTVTGDHVNIRETPSVESKVITQLNTGDLVEFLEENSESINIGGKDGKWTRIKGDFGEGWIFGAFLERASVAARKSREKGTDKPGVISHEDVCNTVYNTLECAEAREAVIGEIYPDLFSSDDKELRISLMDGKSKAYQHYGLDGEEPGEDATKYTLINYFPDFELVLIEIQYYEGGGFILMSRKTGRDTKVFHEPIFSPDRRHFVTNSADLQAGYDVNGFEIYSMEGTFPLQIHAETPNDWAPAKVTWLDNSSFEIERFEMDLEGNSPDGTRSIPSIVMKENEKHGWERE